MKKIFLLALATLPAIAFAQQSGRYVLNGKVGRLNAPAKAYLLRIINGEDIIDSTNIYNGSFQFKGATTDITWATLVIDHEGKSMKGRTRMADAKKLYVEKGKFTVTAKDSVKNGIITGSIVNNDSDEYEKVIAGIDLSIQEVDGSSSSNGDSEERRVMRNKLIARKVAIQKDYILAHPRSYFSLRALKEILLRYDNVAITTPVYKGFSNLYNGLSEDLKNSTEGKVVFFSIKGALSTEVGATAPVFTENDINGHPVNLADFRGKYVLLDFWASWCKPCRADNPNVVKAYNQYKGKNFTILSVSLDRPGQKDKWLKAIDDDHLAWNHVSALNFWKSKAVTLYSVFGVPTNFLIDPSGKIVAKNLHGEELEKKLKEILGS